MENEVDIESLLHRYGTDILRFIRFYTNNDNDAEDLTQEVFVRAHRNLRGFRRDSSPKTWLIQIAVNVCRNHHRVQARHPQVLVDRVPCTETSPSAESEVMKKSEDAELIHLVCNLPIALKEVVLLYYFEEKSTSEIASMLGITMSTVKIRLFRARKALKRGKEHQYNDQGEPVGRTTILQRVEARS